MAKGDKLSLKQKKFVKEYTKTGNATEAASLVYDVKNRHVAQAVGAENLSKPIIRSAIAEALPDDLLAERHLELLNKREVFKIGNGEDVEYEMSDQPETQAVSKALDMAYKIKGSYAPEKTQSVQVNVDLTPKRKELLGKYEKEFEEALLKEINGN